MIVLRNSSSIFPKNSGVLTFRNVPFSLSKKLDFLFKHQISRRIIVSSRLISSKNNKNPFNEEQPLGLTLSDEQLKICELVKRGHNIFYTGSAGTGKSVLLRHIIRELKQQYPSNCLAVTASTGIAAYNINGITLHSFAGIGIGNADAKKLILKIKKSEKKSKNWKNVKILIIDEISMIHGNLLDKLNVIAKHFKKSDLPFGGIQLIFCGDFYQLPPVNKKEKGYNSHHTRLNKYYYRERQSQNQSQTESSNVSSDFAFESQSWKEAIHYKLMLTKVFRQGKDMNFINMLDELRHGNPSDDTVSKFHLLNEPLSNLDGIEPAELYPTRSEVAASNSARLHNLPYKEFVYKSIDMLNGRNKYALNDCLAAEELVLKKHCQVMMLKNLDETLVNGTLGKVIDFVDPNSYCFLKESSINDDGKDNSVKDNKEFVIDDLVFEPIKIEDPEKKDPLVVESIKRKQKYRDYYLNAMSSQKYPLVRFLQGDGSTRDVIVCPETWTIEDEDEVVIASRTQIPLSLAWAISIHKSQGQTLTKLKVDLRKVFEKGQTYVALSRVTKRENLQVLNFSLSKVMTDHKVVDFYKDIIPVDSLMILEGKTDDRAITKAFTKENESNNMDTDTVMGKVRLEENVAIDLPILPEYSSLEKILPNSHREVISDSSIDVDNDKPQNKIAQKKNGDNDFAENRASTSAQLPETVAERPYL